MTLPAIPNSPAVGDPGTAAWADLVAAWITLIANGPLGIIDTATGPAAQTDYTTIANVISRSVALTNGRYYRVTAEVVGGQVTAAGNVVCRLKIAGTEMARALTPQYGTTAATAAANGVAVWVYQAVATSSITFLLTAESSAGAFRIAANACQLTVEDIGIP